MDMGIMKELTKMVDERNKAIAIIATRQLRDIITVGHIRKQTFVTSH